MHMLDTNICVHMIRTKSDKRARVLARYMEKRHGDVVISTITLAELEFGVANNPAREQSAAALSNLLSGLVVLDFGAAAAYEFGVVRANLKRKRTTIGPLDVLIAAHAKATDCVLVTNNTGEFSRVDGLSLEDWTKEH